MEKYKGIPISETKILQEDGTVDTLDNLIKKTEGQYAHHTDVPNHDEITGSGGNKTRTTQEKIEELKALKAEAEYLKSIYEGDGEGSGHSNMGNAHTMQHTLDPRIQEEARSIYEGDHYQPVSDSQDQYQAAISAYENNYDQSHEQENGHENAMVLRRTR